MYWLLNEQDQRLVRDKIDNLVITLSDVHNKVPHNEQLFPFQGRKSIELAKVVIKALSCDGDTICDPFSGSGSFVYAAAALKRNIVANEYELYTSRMARNPLELPDENGVKDAFQQLITKVKPKLDKIYRTKCNCGNIVVLDSLFFDRIPLRYINISRHERMGKNGETITFRNQYQCIKCGTTEKFFDEYDEQVLDELEKLPDDQVFDTVLIENSRINLTKEFTVYKNLFPKRSRIALKYLWDEIYALNTNAENIEFLKSNFLSILPLAKYKDYRSKSQDLHPPPIQLRESNLLHAFIAQFNKRLKGLYGYSWNNYKDIKYSTTDYREFMSGLDDNSVDLLLTDPPWNDGNAYFERAQLYHPWMNYSLRTDAERLAREMIVSNSPERLDKHGKDQWWSDISNLFECAYRILKNHKFLALYFRPVPAKNWIENFNRLKLIARKNGFEPLLCVDVANQDPAMRIQQSAHYAFSSDLIITFLKLSESERRIYCDNYDLDEVSFRVAVQLQDSKAGAFTYSEWTKAMHNKLKEIHLLSLHRVKNKYILDVSFNRLCDKYDVDLYLPKPNTPYSDEIYNTPYIERVSLYIPYVIEELLAKSNKFTFDKFLLKIAEFVENGTRGILDQILIDSEDSIRSLLNIYAEPIQGGLYFTKRPIPEIPSNIANVLDLDPYQFEAFVARLLELEGYKNVVLAGRAGDRGIDIRCNDKNNDLVIVQCKRYTKSKVGSMPIQRLHSFALTRGATKMICITTTDFTSDGYDEACKTNVTLMNRKDLDELIHKHKIFD